MSTTSLLVISDLHLADSRNVLEGFQLQQQAAFEGLLRAALPGGSLGIPSPPMLIVNGDCFDFLAVPPYPADGFTTPLLGLEKLAKIAATHESFFKTLRAFLDQGGRVTFLIGNHDIELCFAEVRAEITRLIDPTHTRDALLHFCLDQAYQPLPDVYIEHGNQYDFWNATSQLWDQYGKTLTPQPERIELPLGTQYMHRAALPISLRYPYFDHFDPPLGITRQIALLSVLDPTLVIETARGVVSMMSNAYRALQGLAPGEERIPTRLFTEATGDFTAFQQNMLSRVPTCPEMEERLYSPDELLQKQTSMLSAFFALSIALGQPLESALSAIFEPYSETGDEDTTSGMCRILSKHAEIRIALAGHTHVQYCAYSGTHGQLYLNTATWIQRMVPPVPAQLTPEVVAWLAQPDLAQVPLTNKTGFVFAWIKAQNGQPSTGRLCAWQGGNAGTYRML
ncbi:MAG TPA: metallophosphoesterase [Ktedonobacteraceae bacterium]